MSGFTLVEMLLVIAMLAILATLVVTYYNPVKLKQDHQYIATRESLINIATAARLYAEDNDDYADDVNRSIPSQFSKYINPGTWARGPFPGSVYDWDNWDDQTCWDGTTHDIQVTLRQVDGYKGKTDYTIYYVIKGPGIPHCSTSTTKGECINCVSRYP